MDTTPERESRPGPAEEGRIPESAAAGIPELEDDETIAPRPEEEVADVLRAEPDPEDHGAHPGASA